MALTFHDDTYIALMPGEKRLIAIELKDADTRGERPAIKMGGYNFAGAERR